MILQKPSSNMLFFTTNDKDMFTKGYGNMHSQTKNGGKKIFIRNESG